MKKILLSIVTILTIAGLNFIYAGNSPECPYSAHKTGLTASGKDEVKESEAVDAKRECPLEITEKAKTDAEGDCCAGLFNKYKATLAEDKVGSEAKSAEPECPYLKAAKTEFDSGECEYSLKNMKLAAEATPCAAVHKALAQNEAPTPEEDTATANN